MAEWIFLTEGWSLRALRTSREATLIVLPAGRHATKSVRTSRRLVPTLPRGNTDPGRSASPHFRRCGCGPSRRGESKRAFPRRSVGTRIHKRRVRICHVLIVSKKNARLATAYGQVTRPRKSVITAVGYRSGKSGLREYLSGPAAIRNRRRGWPPGSRPRHRRPRSPAGSHRG
jgi:hypothetical protein